MTGVLMQCARQRRRPYRSSPIGSRGFTLIELLAVVVVLGILLAVASLSVTPDPRAPLRRDGERLTELFSLAADEAQMRSRPIVFQADEHGYRFLLGDGDQWLDMNDDPQFRARAWEAGSTQVLLQQESTFGTTDAPLMSLEFPRNGQQSPFRLSLKTERAALTLAGDGAGHYVLAQADDPR